MLRLIRKLVILGLAGFGAYSIYERLRPKAEQLASATGSQLDSTMDTVSSVATKVKDDVASAKDKVRDDVTSAKDDVVSDLKQGVDEQKEQLSATADSLSPPVDTAAPQVGLG
jgi:hypothetical protein